MTDHEQALRAARDSLRNVVSIRDFLLAVQVGSETAVAMLDKTERRQCGRCGDFNSVLVEPGQAVPAFKCSACGYAAG
jgi:hypothetical protein